MKANFERLEKAVLTFGLLIMASLLCIMAMVTCGDIWKMVLACAAALSIVGTVMSYIAWIRTKEYVAE